MRCCHLVEIMIFSPDTDVLVLVVANHHLILQENIGVYGIRSHRRKAYRSCSWPTKGKLHAFSGADTVGKFNQLGRATWLNIFMKSGSDTIGVLEQLLIVNETSAQQLAMLGSVVCDAYCPKGIEIPERQWYLFCKHMAESNRFPLASGALKQHIIRVHIQTSVWGQAIIAQQELLDPLQNGFCKGAIGDLVPHTTDDLPAPKV